MSGHSQHAHHLIGPDGHLTPLTSCGACLDNEGHSHATADMAHRDDLARDVATMWRVVSIAPDGATRKMRKDWPGLAAALDRLAAAYGTGERT